MPHLNPTTQAGDDVLHVVVDSAYDWEYWRGPDGDYQYCSPSCERITGYTDAEFYADAELLTDLILPEDRHILAAHRQKVLQDSGAHSIDFRIRARDGRQRWINHVCQPVLNASGRHLGRRGINRDITEHKQAELESIRQREFLERLIESAPMGIAVVCGSDHRFELVNPYYAAIPGVANVPMVGRTLADVFPELGEGQGVPLVEEVCRTGRTVSVRGGCVPSGLGAKDTYWDVDHVPLRGVDGSVDRVLILVREVTDEVLTQQALRESEEKLRTLIDILPVGVSVLNRQREIALCNPALTESLALSPEALAQHSYEKRRYVRADGTEMPPEEFASVRALAEGRVVRDVETGVVKEDGELVWASVSAAPFPFSDWIAIATAVDITERKQLEEALRRTHAQLEERVKERTAELVRVAEQLRDEIAVRARAEEELRLSEERFRQLAENIDEVFWLLEPTTGRYLYVSPAYEALWGRPVDEVRREPAAFVQAVHPDDWARIRASWQDGRSNFDQEFRVLRPDGTVRWARVRAFPVRDAAGTVQRVAGIAEDITADKQAQALLIQAEKHAVASRLAASLAHEINNPLQSAIGCLELAREAQQEGSDPMSYMQVTAEALSQAAEVVAHLRALHQPVKDQPRKRANLNQLVQKTLLLSEKQCQDRGVTMTFRAEAELAEVLLVADALQQVFLNIVLNALDAMPQGGQLQIRTFNSSEPRGVCVEFTDTGTGMSPDAMDSLFESFVSTKADGLGLGLFISQSIVQQHGGRIEAKSDVNHGSTFSVWLPAARDPISLTPGS